MLEYVRHIRNIPEIAHVGLSSAQHDHIQSIISHFDVECTQIVQDIEKKGRGHDKATNHDVKACELYLRDAFEGTRLEPLTEWIHFGRTSEDVNNIAYALMLACAVEHPQDAQ
jgi:adenylosuccinate lyase